MKREGALADEGDDRSRDGGDIETGLWFRDRLQDALRLGAAAFLVLAGWLISNDSLVSLAHPDDADRREAAHLLLIFVPLLWAGWYAYLVRLRSRCPEHATVIGRRWLHAAAWAVAAGLALLLHFVALD